MDDLLYKAIVIVATKLLLTTFLVWMFTDLQKQQKFFDFITDLLITCPIIFVSYSC